MKVYLVYSYDPMPYSDINNHYIGVALSEEKARKYVEKANKRFYSEKSEWEEAPDYLYDYTTIDIIE